MAIVTIINTKIPSFSDNLRETKWPNCVDPRLFPTPSRFQTELKRTFRPLPKNKRN